MTTRKRRPYDSDLERSMGRSPTAAMRRRVATAEVAEKSAASCIGTLEAGLSRFLVTRGQFSMIDAVAYVVNELAPARVSVWTWVVAEYEVEAVSWFFRERRIDSATLVIDRSAEQRNVSIVDTWRDRFGDDSVRVCRTHCKIATVEGQGLRFCLRGSCNLNKNPNFEQLDITEGDGAFDLVRELEAELPVLPRLCTLREAGDATGIRDSWTDTELKEFEAAKLKEWKA